MFDQLIMYPNWQYFLFKFQEFRSGIFTIDISHHLPILIIHKDYLTTDRLSPKEINHRLLNEATLNNFYERFRSEVATFSLDDNNVDFSIELLNEKILSCYNYCCPIKTKNISVKDQKKPWITSEIKESIKKRQNIYLLYRRNLMSKREYNAYRNKVNDQIRSSKRNYFHCLFYNMKNYIKKTWSTINNVLCGSFRK